MTVEKSGEVKESGDSVNLSSESSAVNAETYLERSGVGLYIQDALTVMLENRPEQPLMFLME